MEEQQWRNEFVALDAPATVQTSTTQPAPVKPPRRRIPWKWLIIILLFVISLVGGLLVLRSAIGKNDSENSAGTSGQVKSQEVDLGGLADIATPLTVDNTDKVVINGQLQTTQGIVLTPSSQPRSAVRGQVYLDSTSNELRYYDGNTFLTLATTNQDALTQAEVLQLITSSGGSLPQDLATTASPQFAGLKLGGSNGNSVLLQAAAGTSNITFTLPGSTGTANQCLTTDGNGTLSFSSCALGSGNAFLQGGNAFSAAAVLGTTDSQSLSFITNNSTRLTISSSGNVGINNTSPVNKLAVNAPTTADNAAQLIVATGAAANKGVVIQGVIFQTGNLLEIQDYNASSLFSVGADGVSAFRTGTNSVNGFQVQNASGTAALNVDTTNQRVGIGLSSPSYKLDVNGDVNIVGTSALRIGGTIVCTASGCDSSGSSGFYIQNSTGIQSNANFAIQSANAGYVGGVIRGASGQTANLFNLQISTGTNVLSVNNTGSVTVQPSSNSTTAFQIQNAAGSSNLFIADTTNTRVGIGTAPSYTLDVNGDINIASANALRIGGTIICDSTGCDSGSGSGFYIQNGTGIQSSANFAIQSANATYVGGIIRGAASQSADLLQLQNSSGTNLFNVSATGAVVAQNTTNSTGAFIVKNAAGTANVLVVDTVNNRVGINEYPSGYALDVNGDVNLDNSGALRINGNVVCDLNGCSASTGSGNYIQNGNGVQTNANFAIQSANIGYVGGLIRGASGQTADVFQVQNSSALNMFEISAGGVATFQNSADSTEAFAVKNASGTTILSVDTSNGTVNATNTGGNAFIGTTSNSSSYGVIGTQSAGVGGGVQGVGGGGYGIYGQSASNASGFFQTSSTDGLNSVATLIARANTNQTASVFAAQNTAGTAVFRISPTGDVLSRATTNSTSAFDIQDASSVSLFSVDTSNKNVTIASGGVAGTVQIGNTTGAVAQTINIGNNNTASSTTSLNLGSNIGTSTSILKAGTGGILMQPSNSTAAFQIQNASSQSLFNVDSTNMNISINTGLTGETRAWATDSDSPHQISGVTTAMGSMASTVAGGYMYAIGGDNGATPQLKVRYAKLNADGTLGSWQTNSTDLDFTINDASAVSHNDFIYMTGGFVNDGDGTASSASSDVYYGKVSANGSLSNFTHVNNQLNYSVAAPATTAYRGYLYVIGGATAESSFIPSTPVDYIQIAQINADGSLGSFTTTNLTVSAVSRPRMGARAIVNNGYIYLVGGRDGSGATSTVYYAAINADGTLGSWASAGTLNTARAYHGVGILNGKLYAYGGGTNANTGSLSSVEYATINSDGTLGTFTTSSNTMSTAVGDFAYGQYNGYMYAVGGYASGAAAYQSASQYVAAGPRVTVLGSLDLVSASGQNLADPGSGGALTAGNTNIVGTLNVQSAAVFNDSLAARGNVSLSGQVNFRNASDSTQAFQIQNAAGLNMLQFDTANSQIVTDIVSSLQSQSRTIRTINCSGSVNECTSSSGNIAEQSHGIVMPSDQKPFMAARGRNSVGGYFLYTAKCNNTTCSTKTEQVIDINTTTYTAGDAISDVNVVLANDGYPFITFKYSGSTLAALKCGNDTCTSGNVWSTLNSNSTGTDANAIIGGNGFPFITHKLTTNNSLMTTTCSSASCASSTVITTLNMVINGTVTSTPFYAMSATTTTHVDPGCAGFSCSNTGAYSAAALGADGYPLIVDQNGSGTNTITVRKCANLTCTSMSSQTAISYSSNNIGTYNAIAIPTDNKPLIATIDDTNNYIYTIKCGNASCSSGNSAQAQTSTGTIATGGISMTLTADATGQMLPLVGYKATATAGLKLLRCGDAACSSSGTNTIVSVPTAGGGQRSKFSLTNKGYPVLLSKGVNDHQLELAICVDTTCSSSSVDSLAGGITIGAPATPGGAGQQIAGIYVNSINEGDSSQVFRVTAAGVVTANALSTDKSGNVFIQSSASQALRIQNSSTSDVIMNVDNTTNRVSLHNTLSAISAPTGLAVGAATSGGSLTASAVYRYKVTALDSMGGESGASSEASGTVGSAGTQTLPVTWTAVTGASGYKVYRTAANGAADSQVYLTTVLVNAFTDSGSITAGTATPPSTGTAYTSANQVDTLGQVTIGGNGTPTGQAYVSGVVASGATGSLTAGTIPTYVAIQGRYAYIVNQTSGTLQVIDINNPIAPVSVGSVSTGTLPRALAVQGKYAYVVNQTSNTLQVVDVSNPTSPSSVTTVTTGIAPLNIYISGRYAYIVNSTSNTLQIFDLSNPSSPVSIGTVATGTLPRYVYVQGGYAYVTNFTSNTLQIFNVSNPASPSSVGSVATGTNPRQVVVRGRYAYVANSGSNTFQVFDVSNPASPVSVTTLSTGTLPYAVTIQGRYAYLTNYTSGTIQTIDISNPAAPFSVGTTSAGSTANPNAIAVSGRYAYVTSQTTNSFQIIDLGGMYTQTIEAGSAELSSLHVTTNATFAGDTSFQGGVNVSGSLQTASNFGVGGNGFIQGTLAVAGGIQGGLSITGLSAPSAPTISNIGTAGATTYSYTVTAVSATGGESTASSAGTTATGNATLSSTNYNQVTWSAVAGAVNYKVYRTVGGATQGLLGTTASTYYYDQGGAGSGSAPTSNTTGNFSVTGNANFKPTTDGASAFKVQNAAATVDLFSVDTSGNGTISIQAAADSGAINIGTANSVTVTIGKSAGTGTLVVNGNTTINGNITINGHVLSGNSSGTTTVATNANCGTGCTASVSGNDTAGVITLNTGTTAAAGIQVTVTFANAFGSAPRIVVTPNTVPAASTYPQYHVTSATTTFDLLVYTALTDSKTYTFSYIIIQ